MHCWCHCCISCLKCPSALHLQWWGGFVWISRVKRTPGLFKDCTPYSLLMGLRRGALWLIGWTEGCSINLLSIVHWKGGLIQSFPCRWGHSGSGRKVPPRNRLGTGLWALLWASCYMTLESWREGLFLHFWVGLGKLRVSTFPPAAQGLGKFKVNFITVWQVSGARNWSLGDLVLW